MAWFFDNTRTMVNAFVALGSPVNPALATMLHDTTTDQRPLVHK